MSKLAINDLFFSNCFLDFKKTQYRVLSVCTKEFMVRLSLQFVLTFVFWGAVWAQQSSNVIILTNDRIAVQPKTFFIESVLDDRSNTGLLGTIIQNGKKVSVTLKGGVEAELQRYLKQNLSRNTNLQPIVLRIREFSLNESFTSSSRISGKCQLNLEFAVQKEGKLETLTSFQTGVEFAHPPREYDLYESFIRKMLGNALQYFNQWMNLNAAGNPILAKGVKVTFTDYALNQAGSDTVFYDPERPLVWADFQRKAPPLTKFAAAVYTSIGYEARATVVNQQIMLNIKMKVFLIKSNSWVQPHAKESYALRHEQLHFDITKLVAERFKQKVLSEELPPDDYDSRLQYIYLDSFREMNKMQEQYDGETQHSLIRSEQNRWDEKVSTALKTFLENRKKD